MTMTLQETLQILGGWGVITSMIYVGIQIRINARAMRALPITSAGSFSPLGPLGIVFTRLAFVVLANIGK
jgi:hypothetical protein